MRPSHAVKKKVDEQVCGAGGGQGGRSLGGKVGAWRPGGKSEVNEGELPVRWMRRVVPALPSPREISSKGWRDALVLEMEQALVAQARVCRDLRHLAGVFHDMYVTLPLFYSFRLSF